MTGLDRYRLAEAAVESALAEVQAHRLALIVAGYSRNVLDGVRRDLEDALAGLVVTRDAGHWKGEGR